jgi:hypothetical protein
VWSKVGRFVDSMNIVGDIITNISSIGVIKIHVAVLFTCLVLWVYLMHGYDCLYICGYFLYMLHVYVYSNFSINLYIYRCICMPTFYI